MPFSKVTIIEEAQYISSIKIDELVESLLTFELSFGERRIKRENFPIIYLC